MTLEIDHAAPLDDVKELLREYPASIPVALEANDYEAWLAELPGEYTLLLARSDGADAGCCCLRGLDGGAGEIKRMYVREQFRGKGIARALVEDCIARSRAAGWQRILLDTHSTMTPARTLYESFGFELTDPYWEHPIPGVVFYELRLT
jgi:GNAT superfamily N-acetyltransferase